MRGSTIIRLRPCMRSSSPLPHTHLSRPPIPFGSRSPRRRSWWASWKTSCGCFSRRRCAASQTRRYSNRVFVSGFGWGRGSELGEGCGRGLEARGGVGVLDNMHDRGRMTYDTLASLAGVGCLRCWLWTKLLLFFFCFGLFFLLFESFCLCVCFLFWPVFSGDFGSCLFLSFLIFVLSYCNFFSNTKKRSRQL